MTSDYINNQKQQARVNNNRVLKVYYAHSIGYYDTEIEITDIEFLHNLKHSKIVNPNDLDLGHNMFRYLLVVEKCDSVWYRGETIGVVLEVLTALSMGKPVYSVVSGNIISTTEIKTFARIFKLASYYKHDLMQIECIFGSDTHERFLKLLNGDTN